MPPNLSCSKLVHPHNRLHRLLLIEFGVDLGDSSGAVAEEDAGGYAAHYGKIYTASLLFSGLPFDHLTGQDIKWFRITKILKNPAFEDIQSTLFSNSRFSNPAADDPAHDKIV